MGKKIFIIILIILLVIVIILAMYKNSVNNSNNVQTNDISSNDENLVEYDNNEIVATIQNIEIKQLDNTGTNYTFIYNNENFYAIYSKDNWKIIDSYKIKNTEDMAIICESLIDIYPIHGSDMVSYRTIEDLVKEWVQHNLAYEILSKDSPWKESAKDVDFNPEDEGKNIIDMYKSRINKNSILN